MRTMAAGFRRIVPRTIAAADAMPTTTLNGIDTAALHALADDVAGDPALAALEFSVRNRWDGGTRSTARIATFRRGHHQQVRDFEIAADTSEELLGSNAGPNPQELLLAALNASMIVGFAVHATRAGIAIDSLEIATSGQLDLRRYLGLDPWISPGYGSVVQQVEVRSAASAESLQSVLDAVIATSPVLVSLGRGLNVHTELLVLPPPDATRQ